MLVKPTELLYAIPFIIATIAIYLKVQYSTQLSNKLKGTNLSWQKHMQTSEGMKVFYPIMKSPTDQLEKELTRKANRSIVLFYTMLIIGALILTLVKSELF